MNEGKNKLSEKVCNTSDMGCRETKFLENVSLSQWKLENNIITKYKVRLIVRGLRTRR